MDTCIIELPMHVGTAATWMDKNNPKIKVCDRHHQQYNEREDEFGPFDWERIYP